MLRTIFAITFVAAAIGCSSQIASGITADEACTDIAQARCGRLQACSATLVQTRYGDEMTCLAQEKENCTNGLAAPANGNNATHTESCSQAMATWECADFIDNTSPPPACQQQTGTLAEGGTCVVAGQCQSGFCAVAPGDACGACAAAPVAGDSCADLTGCGPGLTCASDTKICVKFAATNGSCGKGAPCGAGLSCVGADATVGTMGTCQPSATQQGATCDPALKTGSGCDRNAGLMCNSQSKQCQTAMISPAGGPCGSVNHQTALCSAGTCTGSSPGVAGTCTADAAEGEACDTETGPGCVAPARCMVDTGTTGTCHLNSALACQ